MSVRRVLVGTLLTVAFGALAATADEPSALAAKAGPILSRYCGRCHRGEGSETPGYAFNVSSVASLTEQSVVVPGKPDDSDLMGAMFSGRMPPRGQTTLPRPTPEDAQIVREWIAAGAPEFPKPTPRNPITLQHVLEQISAHFQKAKAEDRPGLRYFTLTHLHNDPTVDERHLRMVRAGLAKALNSLSWEARLVVPEEVDPEKTIYAVDIRQLGWNREHWNTLLAEYPYGLGYESLEDDSLARIDADFARLASDKALRHLRADWFVSVALKPKLYHAILYDLTLPTLKARTIDPRSPNNPKQMTDRDLEDFLHVNVWENTFGKLPRARRAGYTHSGISGQNRMIEWHPIDASRSYWKSYDFLASNRRSILAEFPMGPTDRSPFPSLAFKHDGGEIIFTLPNGLQGYLLATDKGNRLDAGPIEIVGDSLKTSGNQLIVNGLSCVVCHRKGMIEPPDDELRKFSSTFADAKRAIEKLYPVKEEMAETITGDSERFLKAYDTLVRKILLNGDDANASVDNLPEPVGETSRRFLHEPIVAETVAAELYLLTPEGVDTAGLLAILRTNDRLKDLGLRILTRSGGSIKRDMWESRATYTLMQETAREVGFTPRK